ncbi:hypothetical protein ANN_07200 [Periplaneta americana]|uniref:Uncharacterized protein n=1 Tax=Periplaneta americana TaxID=6978 RepID=A0ABQ8TI85_PERAM|nr:hypothetical protein ANN_07200 [Periplaneta americana]
MAGLCEDVNEPPGSLKASNEARPTRRRRVGRPNRRWRDQFSLTNKILEEEQAIDLNVEVIDDDDDDDDDDDGEQSPMAGLKGWVGSVVSTLTLGSIECISIGMFLPASGADILASLWSSRLLRAASSRGNDVSYRFDTSERSTSD